MPFRIAWNGSLREAFGLWPQVTLALCCAGCAFRLSDDADATAKCQDDNDCAEFRSCNPITKTCDLQAPPAEAYRLAGPFDSKLSSAGTANVGLQFGGVSMAAKWPKFQSNGYSVPATEARISNQTYVSEDAAEFLLMFKGARHQSPEFGAVGFYRVFLAFPAAAARVGAVAVPTLESWFDFCLTYPKSASGEPQPGDAFFDNTSVDGCTQLFVLPQVSLTITTSSSTRISGYLAAALVPMVEENEP